MNQCIKNIDLIAINRQLSTINYKLSTTKCMATSTNSYWISVAALTLELPGHNLMTTCKTQPILRPKIIETRNNSNLRVPVMTLDLPGQN